MTTPRATLLQAAKAFIAKSAKAAAVIAPLALATVPTEAEAQVVFGPMTSTGASISPSGSDSRSYTALSWFTTSRSGEGSFTAQQFGANYTITNLPATGSDLQATITFSSSHGSSGTLPHNTEVPIAYQFSLSSSPGITLQSWDFSVSLIGGYRSDIAYASGSDFSSQTFSDTIVGLTYDGDGLPSTLQDGGWLAELTINFSATAPTDTITLTTGNSGGFALGSSTLAAVPEPSTYASLVGLVVLGYAAYRRRRAT